MTYVSFLNVKQTESIHNTKMAMNSKSWRRDSRCLWSTQQRCLLGVCDYYYS